MITNVTGSDNDLRWDGFATAMLALPAHEPGGSRAAPSVC